MFRNNATHEVPKRVMAQWFLLALLAGSVNVGGFLGCQRFVSHMTGFATLAGIGLAETNWRVAVSMLSIPLFFLAGAVIAAWFTESRQQRGLRPRYDAAMALAAFCLFCAGTGGALGMFDIFGADFDPGHDYFFVALLCLACGLLNASITYSSSGTVRVTHLTGTMTDLGIGLVQAISARTNEKKLAEIRRRNMVRFGTLVAFIIGAFGGGFVFIRYHYYGFYLPTALCLYTVYAARQDRKKEIREISTSTQLKQTAVGGYLKFFFLYKGLSEILNFSLESVG